MPKKSLLIAGIAALSLMLSGCASSSGDTKTDSSAASDQTASASALKDYSGMNLSDATGDLDSLGYSKVNSQDASSEERSIWIEANWFVCSQKPAAGTQAAFDSTIVLLAVKNSETCPSSSGTDTSGADTSGTDTSGTDTSGTDTSNSGSYKLGQTWNGADAAVKITGARKTYKDGLDSSPDNDFYLVVNVSVTNTSSDDVSLSSLMSFELTGSDGVKYDLAMFVDTKGSMDVTVRPGKTAVGEVAFDVAKLSSYELSVKPSLFGDTGYFTIKASDIK